MTDKPKPIPFHISNVEALWPRINTTYKFDNKQKRSVPCDVFDDGAKYELNFRMASEQAKKLYADMKKAYTERAVDGWPEKFSNPFKKDDDGMYVYKTVLKGAYAKSATGKPAQYDAANTKLDDDFLLTTGSEINIAGVFVPYHNTGMGTGVSLRLRAVQVIKYVPLQTTSPFEVIDGFESEDGNPFASTDKLEADPLETEEEEEEEEEEISEPKKVQKKASGKAKDPELDAIVDDWDD